MTTSESLQQLRDELGSDPDTFPIIKVKQETVKVKELATVISSRGIGNSFILGHADNGALGTGNGNVLGEDYAAYVVESVTNPDNTWFEPFRTTQFFDSANSTADWDVTTDLRLEFDAGEVATTKSIFYNNGDVTSVKLNSTEDSGSYEYFINADGNRTQFNSITPVIAHTRGIYEFESDGTDSSGLGNNLTETAMSYTTGKLGNAASFNGTTSYLQKTSFSPDSNDDFSIACWVYVTDLSSVRTICSWGGVTNIQIETDGRVSVDLAGSTSSIKIYSTNTIPINTWTHVIVSGWQYGTTNQSRQVNEVNIYINGTKETKTSSATAASTSSSSTLNIGCKTSGTNHFVGLIDNFRIYQFPLYGDMVSEIYNSGTGTTDALTLPFYSTRGDDSAIWLYGSQDYLTFATSTTPSNLVFDYTTSFSFSAWFYIPSVDGLDPIATTGGIGRNFSHGIDMTISTTSVTFNMGVRLTSPISRNSGAKTLDEWHHIVGVYNASNRRIYIHHDGNIDTTGADASTQNFVSAANLTTNNTISGNKSSFIGQISNVRFYNKVLSSAEVGALYNNEEVTSGLLAKYSFEEGSGTKVYDTSQWERIENNTSYNLINQGDDLRLKIAEKAGSTGTISKLEVKYTT